MLLELTGTYHEITNETDIPEDHTLAVELFLGFTKFIVEQIPEVFFSLAYLFLC